MSHIYFGYGYWGGDYILCTKQVVDGGSGLLNHLGFMQIRHSSRTWIFLGILICYYTHISETNPFGFITIAISGGLMIILP